MAVIRNRPYITTLIALQNRKMSTEQLPRNIASSQQTNTLVVARLRHHKHEKLFVKLDNLFSCYPPIRLCAGLNIYFYIVQVDAKIQLLAGMSLKVVKYSRCIVAARLRCGGIFGDKFIVSLLLS